MFYNGTVNVRHKEKPAMIRMSWSSGKDSALALYELQNSGSQVTSLFTTMTEEYNRVSIHGVRIELIEQQAAAIGLPLHRMMISCQDDMESYNRKVNAFWQQCKTQGIEAIGFGDIFLEELRNDRVQQLAHAGLEGVFPLWRQDSTALVQRMIQLGFRAIVTCVDTRVLDASFAGRTIDAAFLADLPAHIDPCGENGEFHTFVYDGPNFQHPVHFTQGETVQRGDNAYRDLLPLPVPSLSR